VFSECTSLTSVVIPESVTSIQDGAFSNCTSLTSIIIGDKVEFVGAAAFLNCTSLTSIVISESVISIWDGSFFECASLSMVCYAGTAEQWETISIDKNNENLTNATIYYYSEYAPATEGNFWYYVDGVPTVW